MSIKNLDELKAIINIKDVISSYIPLKKINGTYKALCPFHSEKTPSFVINETKNLFHCFGCKEGGDAISFVQKFKHLDFNEAIKEIANFYNFDLKFSDQKQTQKKNYFAFYERLNKIFKENLLNNEKILNYLLKRGLNRDDLNYFDIGLVPDNSKLKELVGTQDLNLALELGFFIQTQNGNIFSQFANRISFALKNSIFKIIGFSCRMHPYLNFKNSAKYINSKESVLFHKSNFLYNLNFAKNLYFKKDTQEKRMIIVEGFFDSIALHKFGFANVASCGTAFNQTHLATLLKNEINSFALCFDNDEAGLKATLKTCELLFKHNFFETEIWQINSDLKDIGEVLQNKAKLEVDKINAFEFYITKKLTSKQSAKEKDDFLKALLKSINKRQNFYLKKFCLEKIEKVTGFVIENTQTISVLNVNFDAQKTLFKTILTNKRAKNIALELFEFNFFESFLQSYENFMYKNIIDDFANELLNDENIKILNNDDFEKLSISFTKTFLTKEIQKAKKKQNFSLVLTLQKKLHTLNTMLKD